MGTPTMSPPTTAAPASSAPSGPPQPAPEACPLCGRPECADEVEAYLYQGLRARQR